MASTTLIPLILSVLATNSMVTRLVVTQTGAPIRLEGELVRNSTPQGTDSPFTARLVTQNVSGREIILTILRLEVRKDGALAGTFAFIDEHFFGDLFAQNARRTADRRLYLQSQDLTVQGLTVAGGVAFVQFADGSTWGDVDSAQETLREREESLSALQRLAHVFDQSGPQEFAKQLMQPSRSLAVESIQARFAQSHNSLDAHGRLVHMVTLAEEHQREMLSHLGPR